MAEANQDTDEESRKPYRKLSEAKRSAKSGIDDIRTAMSKGHEGLRRLYNNLEGVTKIVVSLVIILVAELAVQKFFWFLTVYTEHVAAVIHDFTGRIEGLTPTDQIVLLILGSLITATLLLSLQLRAIGYSLTKTNVYMEELRVTLEQASPDDRRTATDGGQTLDGEVKADEEKAHESTDSKDEANTSKMGALGGALAGGTYGAIFGVAGIVAGVAIGAMFGDEIEKRISNRETKDRARLQGTRKDSN